MTALFKDPKPHRHVLAIQPIRETPLTLVHFWQSVWNGLSSTDGAIFALVDLQGRLVWSFELPTDYTLSDQEARKKLYELMSERGGILRSDRPREFDLFFAAASQRVTFSVAQDGSGGWTVKETSRSGHTFASPPSPSLMSLRKAPLKPLKPLVLPTRRSTPPSPIHDVHSFAFDDRGRIAFLRMTDDEVPDLVLIDQQGKELRQTAVKTGVKGASTWSGPYWVGGSRFILANSENNAEAKTRALWIDAQTGEYKLFPDFDCPRVNGLLGFADGTFVALGSHLAAFDKQGHKIWTVDYDFSGKPEALVQPQALAATTNDDIIILEFGKPVAKCFDRQGHYLRTIDLKSVLASENNFFAGISTDVDGGFLVERGTSPLARLNADGTVRARLTPKYADGKTIDAERDTRIAPDGKLWTSDGWCLMRLNEKGIVDRVVGQSPKIEELGSTNHIAIDHKGQIYALDSRTGTIHVFDSAGRFRHVCPSTWKDFSGLVSSPAMSFGDQGDVYYGPGGEFKLLDEKCPYAHFGPNGEKLKSVVWTGESCLLQPRTGHLVSLSFRGAVLIDLAGKTIRSLARRPDHCWMAGLMSASVAADGSFAILANEYEQGPPTVNLFTADGDPICTIPLPGLTRWSIEMAYAGQRVVVAAQEGLFFFDRSGAALCRSDLPLPPRRNLSYSPYLLDEGRTLALIDGTNPRLYRYQLP
jgi:hypothetical protein